MERDVTLKFIVMVAIAFQGEFVVGSKIFVMPPDKDLTYCEAERGEMAKAAAERGYEMWTSCLEVSREVKPQSDPKHRDPKSELRS